jgi:hypothetical protein
MRWNRVTKKHPCPICSHTDWCGYLEDAVICMREPSETQTNNGGYLHKLNEPIKFIPKIVKPEPVIDFQPMWKRWFQSTAIGRPSCLGCEEEIVKFIRRNRVNRVVIVTDNDLPGLRGAAKLSRMLPVMSCVWTPFGKDMREFVQRGGDRRIVETLIKDLVWQRAA